MTRAHSLWRTQALSLSLFTGDYHVERTAVASAVKLAPKLEQLMELLGVEIGIVAPLLKDDHQRGVYRLDQQSAPKQVFEIISVLVAVP